MKTALVFLIVAVLIFAGVYYYYLSIGGTPLETLFANALGLQGEDEENGLPIVVDVAPYVAIIAVFLLVGIFLHYRSKRVNQKHAKQN
jgi:amino acid permease